MRSELLLVWAGKTSAQYARIGVAEYVDRIARYRPCREVRVPEERHDGRYTAAHRVEREGAALLRKLDQVGNLFVVALDPRGKAVSSRELADMIRREAVEPGRSMAFVVGGPDGLSSVVRNRADRLIGLSRLTLPHDMARLLLAEQVYRAMTIIQGHPYDR